ncbi:hypothetical protein JCM6882_003917 [Rhodosporidiobolus microsporus]
MPTSADSTTTGEGKDSSTAPPSDPRVDSLRLPPTPPLSPPPALSTPQTTLASLPTEILALVFSHLPPPSLASCALVSRSLFLPLARSNLYRTLTLRNQRHGRAAPSGSSALDTRSTALLATLTAHPALAQRAHTLDFDLLSHLSHDEIAALLRHIFALCTRLTSLRLGAGAHGHGIGFRPLRDALSSSLSPSPALPPLQTASTLRALNVENCNGAPHTLAAVLTKLTALEELRVGQFLLEKGDFDASPSALPQCRLKVFVAERARITPTAFSFLTASSAHSLRLASLPICERTALDLSPFTSLAALSLYIFLSSPPAGLCPAHPAFDRTLARLARNFSLTVHSANYLPSLTLKGAWDAPLAPTPLISGGSTVPASALGAGLVGGLSAGQPVDLVLHARLLHALPKPSRAPARGKSGGGFGALAVRTELNALALVGWLGDEGYWGEGWGRATASGGLHKSKDKSGTEEGKEREGAGEGEAEEEDDAPRFRLQVWQKTSYSAPRREFQARVRERVDAAARERGGVRVEWMRYEQW